MKKIISNRFLPAGYFRQVSKPIGHSSGKETVFQKNYDEIGCIISLRLLSSPADRALSSHFLLGEEETEYETAISTNIAQSNSAQSFIVSVNNKSFCQADIIHANQDDISCFIHVNNSAYVLQLLPEQQLLKSSKISVAILKTCLIYLTTFDEVQQIFIKTDPEDKLLHSILSQAGFHPIQEEITEPERLTIFHFQLSELRSQL